MASKLTISSIATSALVVAVGNTIFVTGRFSTDLAAWIIDLACICLLIGCIGKAINDRWSGVLVSPRNRISLSKLQMTAWTVLVLSALVTAAAHNLLIGDGANALDIVIDPNLLIVMGISTTSLVASPAILSLKEAGSPAALARRAAAEDASWLDLFRGDLAETADTPDLSKIQQFLVSLVVIGTYAILIGAEFISLGRAGRFANFPALSDQVVWLIGISHAGYIASKAAQTPSPALARMGTPRPNLSAPEPNPPGS
ncbi:hypothetical protein AB2M62_06825 [Sphingomonas sp. MMS12-HWE2-04]|uniref:hypothetical protein n=1 Tax=Sphingomonas sp. MMS12-HWE2-04 TaxID=3234199 RepID=UPI003850EF3E